MVNYKITKKREILFVNNDMTTNYYYLVYGKFLNDDNTKYRPFRFVLWFDLMSIQEYYDKDTITKYDLKEYLDEAIYSIIDSFNIKDYNDKEHLKEFYTMCNKTFKDYNDLIGRF